MIFRSMSTSEDQKNKWGTPSPEFAVIVAVGGQRERAARALRSLLEQNIIDRMEILVFDHASADCPSLPGSAHPQVRTFRRSPDYLLGDSRFDGVQAASAPLVCFMEEHCEMQPGCAESIVMAHRGPWAAVGSDFINANPDAGTSNQAFAMNYGVYVQAPYGRGPVPRISGQNSTFKRDALLRYGPELKTMLNSDMVLQLQMAQDGHRFFFEPHATIAHRNETSVRSLATGVFYWNWCYANARAKRFNWSAPRRLLWMAMTPLIPWVRLVRMFRWVRERGRSA